MGTIVSPANGSNFYKGQTIPISYRSDTVDFDCGSSTKICTVFYYVDGIGPDIIPISQNGVAPQTQADQNVTLPTTGTTTTITVEGWSVGGQLNDTATVTLNLVDLPVAVCDPATIITQTTAQLNATITGTLLAGGSARFVWGAPTPNTNAATTYTAGAVNAALTGLTPNTTYNYRLEILDGTGAVIAQSGQCTFTTLAAVATPIATCAAGTAATQTTATLNGTLVNIPVGGSARFRYGTVAGGPYPTNAAATPYANGAVTANVTGLTASTTYYYVLEILDNAAAVVATSAECSVTTSAVVAPTTTTTESNLVKLCSITGVAPMRNCATNAIVLLVHVASSDGDLIPTDSTEFPAPATGAGVFSTIGYFRSYYADQAGHYLAAPPATLCGPDHIEIICACDDADGDGIGEVSYRRIVSVSASGVVTQLATYDRTLTTPYTPVAPIDCNVPGDNLIATRPKYRVLNGVDTWVLNADSVMPTISVTIAVLTIGNTATPPTLQTAEGTYDLFGGTLSFSAIYGRDVTGLRPPFVVTTGAGDVVAIWWAEEVI